ncbi:hypothetical protein [Marilutibacter aestuarii]|uniref:Alanine acetyltransferase n=1 Tax=Marilutibacter aestuarii TaxID=1706195 RepID=A0A507ZN47_9GAMM|nr:hypothetical protein [Lysobacter aestuarii]TQD38970.1 hypothetical protein FKV25_15890 [Lysobacter aestuarii]
MSLPWTAEQREWLQALGHPVMMPVGGPGAMDVETHAPVPRTEAGEPPGSAPPPDRGPMLGIPKPRPMAPVLVDLPVSKAPPATAPDTPAVAPARLDLSDPLYRALLRATAQRTPREGQAVLAALEFELEALRDGAVAKRALWHALRAARRGSRR